MPIKINKTLKLSSSQLKKRTPYNYPKIGKYIVSIANIILISLTLLELDISNIKESIENKLKEIENIKYDQERALNDYDLGLQQNNHTQVLLLLKADSNTVKTSQSASFNSIRHGTILLYSNLHPDFDNNKYFEFLVSLKSYEKLWQEFLMNINSSTEKVISLTDEKFQLRNKINNLENIKAIVIIIAIVLNIFGFLLIIKNKGDESNK